MRSLRFLLLPLLLLVALACSKNKDKDDPAPSKTALLTGVTWRENGSSLAINGVEGTQTVSAADADSYKFSSDGKLVVTPPSGPATNGTWALSSDESQLTLTLDGQMITQQIFTLNATSLSTGVSFTQAQVQAALKGQAVPGVPAGLIALILLSAGNYTFPANTPTIYDYQITSLQLRANWVPK